MGEVEVTALQNIQLAIHEGEILVLLGPSGSGKSTLLNLIGGIDRPTTGHLWYRDIDLTVLDDGRLTDYRRTKIGFVFQFYNLVPTLTAYENVLSGAELVSDPIDPGTALEMVGLAGRANHFPAQLSGGEQQRVAIARAFVKRPELILADEPTGALDIQMARHVLRVIQQLNYEHKITVLLITHNPAIAEIGNRSVKLVSGNISHIQINEHPISADEVTW
jgi:putative ABC transport system ATP-binding protein